jgi:hypothetical protein
MARGKKTGGRDLKPGETANPNGRPKVPEDIKQLRQLNKDELLKILNKYVYLTKSDLKDALQKEDTPAVEMMVGTIILKAIQSGDHSRLTFILDRLIGPNKQSLEIQGSVHAQIVKLLQDVEEQD